MPVTVQQAIDHARDLHPGFGDWWSPHGGLLRFWTRYQQRLLAKLCDKKQDAVDEPVTVPFPLGLPHVFPLYTLEDEYLHVHGGDVHFNDTQREVQPLKLIPFKDRNVYRHRLIHSAYLQGQLLTFLGNTEEWREVDQVILHVFPVGRPLLHVSFEFQLPGQPLEVLTAGAAYFIATRRPGKIDVLQFQQDETQAVERYLDQASGRRRASVTRTREVM